MNKIKFIVKDFFVLLGIWLIGFSARDLMGEMMEKTGRGIQDYEHTKQNIR